MTRCQSTASPPPVKHLKLESGRRDRVKTPGGKTAHKGPRGIAESAVTPPKVVKCQKKSAQSGVSITAEKGGILPGGRDATASTVVTGQETTTGVIAQEGRSIVTGQETTAGVSAQEGRSIVTGQETTAGVIAQEGRSIVTGQETTPESVPRRLAVSSLVRRPPTESVPRRAGVSSLVRRPPPESVPRRAAVSSLVRRPPPESVPRRAPAATAPLGNEGPSCHTPMHRSETRNSPPW
ncbi:hypothetical protein NDU88_001081 [Pleurodeles waltl]|uniref:Uncharacterized protein n=1 Tax=Pleurodeles waltl TaxID=8319 RepID=A0AAV7LA95_PLEWA|nr:hypothetical protein NDU88_001081 [Pleurodeles waltl]